MTQNKKIRVLIVDDSAFMRKVLADIISEDPSLEVIGKARNGQEALLLVRKHSPDVITLDMEMPGKNGLEVLREIMAIQPTPVVMVSSLTREGANVTMQALDSGAVDFVTKPSGMISLDMQKVGDELRQKVVTASRASIQNVSSSQLFKSAHAGTAAPEMHIAASHNRDMQRKPDLLVIASSTGGPNALQEVIPSLSENFPLPILIVQHMPAGFTSSFALRLNERSRITVLEGCDGMQVRRGVAIVAPGGYHLTVEKKTTLACRIIETPPVRSVRPAADVLFASVADVVGGGVIVLVLTGMGKDGLDGTRLLRSKGAYVIAEAKETCVVFGMPGSIVDAGLADEVLPLYSIAAGLERVAKQ
jgi:two-component system chemotaxis response regulator CheB